MPALTPLSDEDLAAIAACYGVRVAACRALWAGTINSNFELEGDRGRLFLRVNEGKGESEVAYEAALLEHLAARGVPTPRPLAARDGRGYARLGDKLVTLFPWVEGEHADPPSPAQAAALGAALARLHLAGREFALRRESRYGREQIRARALGLAGGAATPAGIAALLSSIVRALDELPVRAVPRGVIHGDLFPDNALFAGERVTLLDFEQASDGDLVYDLAVCLLSWCWDGADLDGARAAALAAGYRAVRPLASAEEAALFDACRFAALRFTVTRISDVELDPRVTDELRRIKDYRDYQRRWRRLEELGEPGLRSLLAWSAPAPRSGAG